MDFSINNIAIVKKPLNKDNKTISEEKLPVEHAKTLPMPLYHPNKYMVNFKGLTREMKKTTYKDSYEIKLKMQEHANSKGVVGSLPHEWIEKIPFKKREENIKELYASLKPIIRDLRYAEDAQKSSDAITEAFQKAGIISKEENITLKYLNEGAFGKVYKLKGIGKKDEYVIKLYKSDNENCNIHGNYIENARAAFWQEKAGTKTERAKFFFGDMESGYMVNKFIGDSVPETKKLTNPKKYGLNHNDEAKTSDGHNKIRGYAIDFGGFEVENPVLTKNQIARNIYEKMFDCPIYKETELFEKFYALKNDEINVGLAASLNLLPKKEAQDYFKLFALSDNKKVIEALAYNLDIMESDELNSYFKDWTNKYKDDEDIKKALISNFDNFKINYNNQNECFKLFAQNATEEIKIALINHINNLSDDDKRKYFENFSIEASDVLKEAIIYKFDSLIDENCLDLYETFAKDADKNANIKIALINNMSVLSREKKQEWFKIFAQNADEKIIEVLCTKLYYLPNDERVAYFEDFAKNAGSMLKRTLIEKALGTLPTNKIEDWFEKFANDSNENEKLYLIYFVLTSLSDEKIVEWFEKFANEPNEKIKITLFDRVLKNLPNEKREEWFEKLANDTNLDIKSSLLSQIDLIENEKQVDYFVKILQNANDKEKKDLIINHLNNLDDYNKKEALKLILKDSHNDFKQELGGTLEFLALTDDYYFNNLVSFKKAVKELENK